MEFHGLSIDIKVFSTIIFDHIKLFQFLDEMWSFIHRLSEFNGTS